MGGHLRASRAYGRPIIGDVVLGAFWLLVLAVDREAATKASGCGHCAVFYGVCRAQNKWISYSNDLGGLGSISGTYSVVFYVGISTKVGPSCSPCCLKDRFKLYASCVQFIVSNSKGR